MRAITIWKPMSNHFHHWCHDGSTLWGVELNHNCFRGFDVSYIYIYIYNCDLQVALNYDSWAGGARPASRPAVTLCDIMWHHVTLMSRSVHRNISHAKTSDMYLKHVVLDVSECAEFIFDGFGDSGDHPSAANPTSKTISECYALSHSHLGPQQDFYRNSYRAGRPAVTVCDIMLR